MTSDKQNTDATVSDQFHPWIWRTIVALALLVVVSVWGFFGNPGDGFALAVVSLFFFVAVAIPLVLWQIWRRHRQAAPDQPPAESFRAWQARDFETWGGSVRGRDAMIEALLPIVAVSFGMAAFALVLYFSVGQ